MIEIHQGDALEVLRTMPDNHVHCIVTSPPYWGLRDYGAEGQLGLEKTPELYLEKMVEVFRQVRRVLREDGTLWLNMGDSYANDGKWGGSSGGKHVVALHRNTGIGRQKVTTGLKPKDLCMMPARLAIALQADGWWLRSEIVWAKPNPMPESVTDRPTKSHEMIYLLTKRAKYFYDQEAIKERIAPSTMNDGRLTQEDYDVTRPERGYPGGPSRGAGLLVPKGDPHSRNARSVWTIATEAYPMAHFAIFPRKLAERCILAGTSERGCCPTCGKPWVRVVERQPGKAKDCPKTQSAHEARGGIGIPVGTVGRAGSSRIDPIVTTLGWQPTCSCGGDPVSCTVLDPFGGSGTTAEVAIRHGRRAILIELKPEYVELARKRLAPALEMAKQSGLAL